MSLNKDLKRKKRYFFVEFEELNDENFDGYYTEKGLTKMYKIALKNNLLIDVEEVSKSEYWDWKRGEDGF